MEKVNQWQSRSGFVLAAVGSAVGLGNIWRFPYLAYENGGGAFLIPYLIALVTAGIPILMLEFNLGYKLKGSAPLTFSKLGNFEWLGWWQVTISFVISTYYAVIVAWALSYAFFSIPQSWGTDTGGFLFNSYLGLTETWNVSWLGGLQLNVVIPLVFVWLTVYIVLSRGVKKGIEKANKIFMPVLFILVLIMAIRGVTLDGASLGLNALFTPDWSGMTNASVWIAAYGQVFFSLSIAFAIMITYASYLPEKSDINNNAFMTGLADVGFCLLAGVAVFGALGFMATQQGVAMDEVVAGGVGLAFAVFPQILNEMPLGEVVGVFFFVSLVFAGLSSLISIVETFIAAFIDKFNIERKKAVNWSVGVAALVSLLFATGSGLYLLDVADYFINNYGIVFSGLAEIIIIGWVLNRTGRMRKENNELSDFSVGPWWNFCLIVITPAILGYMTIKKLTTDLTVNYEGYPDDLIALGWSTAILALILGFYLQSIKGKNPEFGKLDKGDAA